VTGLHRGERRRTMPLPDATLNAGDVLILEGEPEALERAIAAAGLQLEGSTASRTETARIRHRRDRGGDRQAIRSSSAQRPGGWRCTTATAST
jgi:hypothetical protein